MYNYVVQRKLQADRTDTAELEKILKHKTGKSQMSVLAN